jgi:hypothetical protein
MADALAPAGPALVVPVRNRYFYGKLLDVRHFELEQAYLVGRRRLLNRLGLGAGVLCGLEVTATPEGQIQISAGVAVDGRGREIVVPSASCVTNPAQVTDDLGRPLGDPLTSGDVTICLAYLECDAEPVPVLVGDCTAEEACAPSSVIERFRILVREGLPDTPPGGLDDAACDAIFPESQGPDHDVRLAACETISPSCAWGDDCVVLATATLPSEGQALAVDACTDRTTVYSNAMLFDLLACLADRVAACCGADTRSLEYVSGDAQSAEPGAELAEPVVVRVEASNGDPVAGEAVTFAVHGGGGSVSDGATSGATVDVTSAADGTASATWTLGPAVGLNTVEAAIASGSRVSFVAAGTGPVEPPPPPEPPDVEVLFPPNGFSIRPDDNGVGEDFFKTPRLEISFDRKMDEGGLQDPDPWLRFWAVTPLERGALDSPVAVHRIKLGFTGVQDPPAAPGLFTVVYRLEQHPIEFFPGKYLVQMRSEGGLIVDADHGLDLDAEFAGTRVSDQVLDAIWEVEDERFGPDLWNALTEAGPHLPRSGDGVPGGRFHASFEGVLG